MAGAGFDEVAALVYGAELLDGGVEEYAAWAEAMMHRFDGRELRPRLRALHAMARELRLHQPADRTRVAPQIIAHRTPQAGSGNVPHEPQGSAAGVEDHAAATAFTFTTGSTGAARAYTNTFAAGDRGSWINLIMSSLVCVMLAGVMLSGELGIGVLLIAFLVGSAVLSQLRRMLRPPQLRVQDGVFSIQLEAHYETPASNVSQLMMAGGATGIIFGDLRQVSPPANQLHLARQIDKSGVHLIVRPGIFTLEQINNVRHALGLAPQSRDESASRLTGFYETLAALTPRPFVTPAIVIANVVVFAALAVASGTLGTPDLEVMIGWGANFGPLTTGGQWWRLFSCMFLHGGLLHLLFNMWILWSVGKLVERLVGSPAYAVAYLTSGFLGSLASVLWNSDVVSVGASGAVFGVFGVLVGFLSLHRKSIPGEAINEHRNAAVAFLAFNLIFGFSISWIDMAAHVGGLVAGFACGLLLSQEISRDAVASRRVRTAILFVVSILVCGTAVWLLPERTGGVAVLRARVAALDRQSAEIYEATVGELQREETSRSEAGQRIGREIVDRYAQLEKELAPSRAPAEVDSDRPNETSGGITAEQLGQYVRLRHAGWEAMAEAVRTGDLVQEGVAVEKFEAAGAALRGKGDTSRDESDTPTNWRTELARLVLMEKRAFEQYNTAAGQAGRKQIGTKELADLVEKDVLPRWRAGRQRFVSALPDLPEKNPAMAAGLTQQLQLQEEAWGLLVHAIREGDETKRELSRRKSQAADEIRQELWSRK